MRDLGRIADYAEAHPDHLEAVAEAYEAAMDATRLPALLERLVRLARADAGIWVDATAADKSVSRIVHTGLDRMSDYAQLAWDSPLAPGMLRSGPYKPLTVSMLVNRPEFEMSEFFQDWVRPNSLGSGLFGVLGPLSEETSVITLMRGKAPGTPSFDEDPAIRHYEILLPYLGRAQALRRRLDRAALPAAGLESAPIDTLAVPAFGLDASLAVLWMNETAEALLRKADGLCFSGKTGLLAATAPATSALQQALRAAVCGLGGAVRLDRPSGAAPLSAITVPVRPRGHRALAFAASGSTLRALLYVFDPAEDMPGNARTIQKRLIALFGLTSTEASIGLMLARGSGIPATAAALGLAASTVRTHAKHIFSKMGVHSQAELTRIVERIGMVRG